MSKNVELKLCKKCGQLLKLADFFKDGQRKSGLSDACKSCFMQRQLTWKQKNKEKVSQTNRRYRENNPESVRNSQRKHYHKHPEKMLALRLKKRFKLSVDAFYKMYDSQGGKCAICGIKQSDLQTRLAVDHCHTTNKIRGLLCGKCNKGLGLFGDSPKALLRAIAYLKKGASDV